MVKEQQMRWMQQSAHLLLQGRTRVLNDELRDVVWKWYQNFSQGMIIKGKLRSSLAFFHSPIWSKFKVTSNLAAKNLALRQQLIIMKQVNTVDVESILWANSTLIWTENYHC